MSEKKDRNNWTNTSHCSKCDLPLTQSGSCAYCSSEDIRELGAEVRLRRIEQLLNGLSTSDEIFAPAYVCELLASLIEIGYQEKWQGEKLREILRQWGSTTQKVESERRSK